MGSIATDKVAGLTVVDFATGDMLYTTGDASIIYGDEANAAIYGVQAVVKIDVTSFTLVHRSLPVRLVGELHQSLYSPAVRPLAWQKGGVSGGAEVATTAHLRAFIPHPDDEGGVTLATLKFDLSPAITVRDGQHGVFDMRALLRGYGYRHMAPGQERSLNDAGLRSWTLSAVSPTSCSITIRRADSGAVTPLLIAYGSAVLQKAGGVFEGPAALAVPFMGVGGELFDGLSSPVLFVCAGIGITPALAFLRSPLAKDADVRIILAARGAEIGAFEGLIRDARDDGPGPSSLGVSMLVQGTSSPSKAAADPFVHVCGRLNADVLRGVTNLLSRQVIVCGPPRFERAAVDLLRELGIPADQVRRESFNF